jgi:hypothetical protein
MESWYSRDSMLSGFIRGWLIQLIRVGERFGVPG